MMGVGKKCPDVEVKWAIIFYMSYTADPPLYLAVQVQFND